jgi:hypothetical protein
MQVLCSRAVKVEEDALGVQRQQILQLVITCKGEGQATVPSEQGHLLCSPHSCFLCLLI